MGGRFQSLNQEGCFLIKKFDYKGVSAREHQAVQKRHQLSCKALNSWSAELLLNVK